MTALPDLHRISDMEKIWHGGYFHGDPADPMGSREYGALSLISFKFAILKALVEPNLTASSRVLEIGPGRGAWTKAFERAAEIYAVDVLSAEHNAFWQYVGEENRGRIRYIQATDTDLAECPDDHFDFLFSFGAFCHMPPATQRGYYASMFRKARAGATGVVMFADFDKHNACLANLGRLGTASLTRSGIVSALRFYAMIALARLRGHPWKLDKETIKDQPGRFFHMGISETADYLRSVGWDVASSDVELNLRDPIVFLESPFRDIFLSF